MQIAELYFIMFVLGTVIKRFQLIPYGHPRMLSIELLDQ
jgi:hypothetical protein